MWMIAAPVLVQADALDETTPYSFAIVDQQIGDVLQEFAGAIGRSVNLGEGVEGRLTNFRGNYTPLAFLEAVTSRFGLVWYDDGAAIHISRAEAMKSIVIDFDRVPPEELTASLVEMGVADPRFALRQTAAGIGVVTGPDRYVDVVENTFLMLAARRADGAPDRPQRQPYDMLVVRGEDVSVWSGLVEEEIDAEADADSDETADAGN